MYVFARTNNPRLTFHLDMTAEEKAIMAAHVAYWRAPGRGANPASLRGR